MKTPLTIAHRGASGSAPENTLESIGLAMGLGADWIEIDIRQTRDGVLVCIHDEHLGRTTNGKGLVISHSYKHIKELDAGSWFDEKFRGVQVPSLNEVMAAVKGQSTLLVELKGTLLFQWGFLTRLQGLMEKHNAWDWVILQSFNGVMLNKLRNIDSRFKLCHLINFKSPALPFYIDRVPRLGAPGNPRVIEAVNPSFKYLNPKLVQQIKAAGKQIMVWTVDREEDMRQLIEWEVDGIITNHPERLLKIIGNMNPSF